MVFTVGLSRSTIAERKRQRNSTSTWRLSFGHTTYSRIHVVQDQRTRSAWFLKPKLKGLKTSQGPVDEMMMAKSVLHVCVCVGGGGVEL